MKRTCARCGRAFVPRHARQTYCDQHELRGRAHRSPTTQTQDAAYLRLRAEVLAGDPPCYWCGAPHADTLDAVVPISHGGQHTRANSVAACSTCNYSRRDNPDWRPPPR